MRTLLITLLSLILFAGPLAAQSNGMDELSDSEIADAIEDQYFNDHAINANRINIASIEGIVELEGTVSNIQASDRAVKLAQRIKGVRSVINRIEVDPLVVLLDAQIVNKVEGALYSDPATDSYEIDVSVSDGVVTLSGIVDSYEEKNLCGHVAKSVVGVKGLENRINVVYDDLRPDMVLEKEIEAALKWNVMIDESFIEVNVDNGIVSLVGSVGSAEEKSNAVRTAHVAGVKSVKDDKLEVMWWVTSDELRSDDDVVVTDEEISSAINAAAAHDPRVLSYNIEPDVKRGWVTLRGTVDNLKSKMAAENIANNTVGVYFVTNRLKVSDVSTLSDTEIREKAENALGNNAVTEAHEIDVTVRDGIATLRGTVDGFAEKKEAGWVVAGIRGVTELNNLIDVTFPMGYYWYGYYPYYRYNYPVSTYPFSEYGAHVYGVNPDDASIKKDVSSQLWWSPFVNKDQVEVKVKDGIVTLSGEVDSEREYNAAVENAWDGGAWAVINKLTIDRN